MGVPVPVGSSPQLLSRSVAKPYLIFNSGTQTVYIGTDSSVSPSNFAFPLAPNNAFQWQEINSDVYGVCANGATSTVVIAPEASAFSVGAVSAQITNPVTIGGGNVGISGGNVGVSGSVSNPNSPAILSTTSTNINTVGSPANLTNIPNVVGIGNYSSLVINLTDTLANALSPLNMVSIQLYQTLNGVQVTPVINPQWVLGSLKGSLQIPVVGDTLVISGQYVGTFPGAAPLVVQIIGSNEQLQDPRYLSYNTPMGFTGMASGGYYSQSTAGTIATQFTSSRNGSAILNVYAGSGTSQGNASIGLCEFVGPAQPLIFATGAIPTGGSFTQPLTLPMRPIFVNLRATAGSVGANLLQ